MLHYNGRKWRVYLHNGHSLFKNMSLQLITAKGMRNYLEKVISILIQVQLSQAPLLTQQTSVNNNLMILPSTRFAQLSLSTQVVALLHHKVLSSANPLFHSINNYGHSSSFLTNLFVISYAPNPQLPAITVFTMLGPD